MAKEHYDAIDGLRTIACVGIVAMHMATNNSYYIKGFLYEEVIPSFSNFVFLFMTISAFSMCCGYYDKVLNNTIDLTEFYSKRFKKILLFFGVLVLLDLIISPSLNSLYEAFADLTLLFGFLSGTKSISVIGVGWFLGLIFVFYLVFPAFCVLIRNKRSAWAAFVVSILYNFVCASYFNVGRENILYSACYLLTGGLIYLYRDKIKKWNKWAVLSAVGVVIVLHYMIGGNTVTWLLVSGALLMYAVVCGSDTQKSFVLENQVTKFISSISMEIYLSHMVIFRITEKLGLNELLGNGWLQYSVTTMFMIGGTIVFALAMQKLIVLIERKIDEIRENKLLVKE